MVSKKDLKNPPANVCLPIYGIGTKSLTEYVTSEKDLIRKINRIPNWEFLLDVLGTGKKERSAIKS